MATETKNLKLNKPDKTDFYDIAVQNENMDKIDEAIAGKASKADIPSSLPADGGNADTVGGFTVGASVPANAKFTDTVYTHPTTHPASMIIGLPTSLPANGGNANYANNSGTTNQLSVTSAAPSSPFAGQLWIW